MTRLLLTIAANGLGIYFAARFIPGFEFTPLETRSLTGFTGTFLELAIAAIVFALINWTIRPIIKLITGPLIILTLGLFTFVVNLAMLWLLDFIIPGLIIQNLTALILGTVLLGLINAVATSFRK